MTSMPQPDGPEQSGNAEQSGRPSERTGSGTVPGQQDYDGTPSGSPGQRAGASPGQQQGVTDQRYGSPSGQQRGNQPGWGSPVNEAETRVTWRRIFQYWIDAFLVWIIPALVSIPFDRSGSTLIHVLGGIVAFVLFLLIGIWYWVIRPHSHNGQTFAMKWFGLRVISKDGGPANLAQMFVRWVCLLFDLAPWTPPFTGLLGLIVMLCSRHRQRIGDHLGRTLVISTGALSGQDQRYAYAGQSGMASQSGMGRHSGMGGGQSRMDSESGGQSGAGREQYAQPGQQGQFGQQQDQFGQQQDQFGQQQDQFGQQQGQFGQQQYGPPDRNS